MYIYQIESEYYNQQEHDNNYTFAYVAHDQEFSAKEFDEICRKGLEKISYKEAYILCQYLKSNYGFKSLPLTCCFSFTED